MISEAVDFTLYNSHHQAVTLSDYKGQWIVLYFYPKDMSIACTHQANQYQMLLPEFTQQNIKVFGISKDSEVSHIKFKEKYGLDVELLSDVDLEVCEKYGVYQMKKMYGREFMGIVRTTFIISPEFNLVKCFEKVKAKEDAQSVLDWISNRTNQ